VPGPKTNEAPVRLRKGGQRGSGDAGARAVARYIIRGLDVTEAAGVLRFCERDAAITVGKLLKSAVANAENNEQLSPEELYVSACYCDEGPTIKRWRPRARGRVNRIRKRTSHITVVVSRMPDQAVARVRARSAQAASNRAARVAATRAGAEQAVADRRRAAAGAQETVAGATLTEPVETEVLETPAIETPAEVVETTEAVATESAESAETTESGESAGDGDATPADNA
jgi:large subunit ribosomal protein L22